jgi:hypothetical protein
MEPIVRPSFSMRDVLELEQSATERDVANIVEGHTTTLLA